MLQKLIADYGQLGVLPFDLDAANRFFDLKQARIRVGTMDLRIAAVALERQFIVLTRNTVDFERVPGLKIEDWTR
jgi:tRNA(fMet)-specific endonuclease VapC